VWLIGAVAAMAVLASNVDKILSITLKWVAPYIVPYISPVAIIQVTLEDGIPGSADIFIAETGGNPHAIAVDRVQSGRLAKLSVPANIVYTIGWQGSAIEAGATGRVLAVKGESSFHLMKMDTAQGQIKVALRQDDASQATPAATEPSARLLLSAQAVQAAGNAGFSLVAGALPELDRAAAIVGLFETGTTDCARHFMLVRDFRSGANANVPVVGCMGASIPGWLADILTILDEGESHSLDALLGDAASQVRALVRDHQTMPDDALRAVIERLTASPEFWVRYQNRVLAAYIDATVAARKAGLTSERGRLLLFDRLVQMGPGGVQTGLRVYNERFPEGAANRPATESQRIRVLGDIFKSAAPGVLATAFARRIDTIVSGRGTVRGIAFDLNQLGVSDEG
jgi:hypothetical protein